MTRPERRDSGTRPPAPAPSHLVLKWLGHATALLDVDGSRLVTDPVFRKRIVHLRRDRAVDPPRRVDAVLLSHLHYDHLDLPSLASFALSLPIVVPRGGARYLRGFEEVIEVEAGDSVELGSLQVDAVEAAHDGRRRRLGPVVPALGYVVNGSWSVYFAGDTDLFPGMAALAAPDLALLPVAGWGSRLGPGHLDPQRAADALTLIHPAVAVPIHWGTYRSGKAEPKGISPGEAFAVAAAVIAPEVDVRVLPVGGTLRLGAFTRRR